MVLDSSSQRELMTSSMKYGALEIREEEILFPLEEAQQMLNKPLQTFLNRFSDYSTPDINLLHLRTITSVFSKLDKLWRKIYHQSSVQV